MEYGNSEINQLVWMTNDNRYHHEEADLTLDNPNVNLCILGKQIKSHSNVLDVGCGEGKLAKLLSNQECLIYGIEIDRVAIKYAIDHKRFKDIFCFNIEKPETDPDEYRRFMEANLSFDYIVLADVLEHVIDPTKVIMETSHYLKEDGCFLISIPNINNADIVLNLMRGRFNYSNAGILDNTHTKYFTKSSFIEWIADVNKHLESFHFDCEYLGGTYGLTSYMEIVKKNMPILFQFLQLNPDYSTIQHLFCLRRCEKESPVKNLDSLLQEPQMDLVEILSEYLEKGMNEHFFQSINGIKMLPNERSIMEARILSAENGWKECDKKLQLSYNTLEQCRNDVKRLNKKIRQLEINNETAIAGWKLAEANFQKAMTGWKLAEANFQKAMTGWKQAETEKEEFKQVLLQTEKEQQKMLEEWKLAEENYQKAMVGWKLAEENFQKAMAGWKVCDEQLNILKEQDKS